MRFSPWEIPPSLFVFETGMSNRGQIMGFFKCTFHWVTSWRNQGDVTSVRFSFAFFGDFER